MLLGSRTATPRRLAWLVFRAPCRSPVPWWGWVGSRAGAWWFENWIVDASRGRPFGGVFCC